MNSWLILTRLHAFLVFLRATEYSAYSVTLLNGKWTTALEDCSKRNKTLLGPLYEKVRPGGIVGIMNSVGIKKLWTNVKWQTSGRRMDGSLFNLPLQFEEGATSVEKNVDRCIALERVDSNYTKIISNCEDRKPVVCQSEELLFCGTDYLFWAEAVQSCINGRMTIVGSDLKRIPDTCGGQKSNTKDIYWLGAKFVNTTLSFINLTETTRMPFMADVCKRTEAGLSYNATCALVELKGVFLTCSLVPCEQNHSYVCVNRDYDGYEAKTVQALAASLGVALLVIVAFIVSGAIVMKRCVWPFRGQASGRSRGHCKRWQGDKSSQEGTLPLPARPARRDEGSPYANVTVIDSVAGDGNTGYMDMIPEGGSYVVVSQA